MTGPACTSTISVDGARLIERLERLAEVGAAPGGGVSRLAWSPAITEALELVGGWAEAAGARVRVDGAGNVIAAVEGDGTGLPPLVTGSHLDTVVAGGPLDGAYGVVAGIEVMACLKEAAISLRRPLHVLAYANEEGVVAPAFTGSRAIVGRFDPSELRRAGPDGVTLAERLSSAAADPSGPMAARWSGPVAATVELHIEQGPVLHRSGTRIGVVTAITGQQRGRVSITGAANHAGTTPMDNRSDSLVAAAEAILALRQVAVSGPAHVATVGRIDAFPNVANVIAGRCWLSVDIRADDLRRIEAAVADYSARLEAIAERTGTTISVEFDPPSAPTLTDPGLRRIIGGAAAAHGFDSTEIVSGAGHDCANLSTLGPIAMIFVPSVGGVSHHPSEWTEPDDLVAGAAVLLNTLVVADRQLARS